MLLSAWAMHEGGRECASDAIYCSYFIPPHSEMNHHHKRLISMRMRESGKVSHYYWCHITCNFQNFQIKRSTTMLGINLVSI